MSYCYFNKASAFRFNTLKSIQVQVKYFSKLSRETDLVLSYWCNWIRFANQINRSWRIHGFPVICGVKHFELLVWFAKSRKKRLQSHKQTNLFAVFLHSTICPLIISWTFFLECILLSLEFRAKNVLYTNKIMIISELWIPVNSVISSWTFRTNCFEHICQSMVCLRTTNGKNSMERKTETQL